MEKQNDYGRQAWNDARLRRDEKAAREIEIANNWHKCSVDGCDVMLPPDQNKCFLCEMNG